jgi:hypothetical protein
VGNLAGQDREDISERLDVTPATFHVIVTRRLKYRCAQCREVSCKWPQLFFVGIWVLILDNAGRLH